MVQYFPIVTGSLIVSGSITATGAISMSGSIASASFAANAATASFVTLAQTASFVTTAQTASFVANAQSASNAVAAQTASYANTFTVAGNLTAQTLVVQTITSSVDFVTGSTRFGSLSSNTHTFTGSISVSGSINTGTANVARGTAFTSPFLTNGGNLATTAGSTVRLGSFSFDAGGNGVGLGIYGLRQATGSNWTTTGIKLQLDVDNSTDLGGNLFISSNGYVGIGTTGPLSLLDVTVLASGARRLLVNYDDSLVTIKSANASSTAENLRVWGDNIYFYTGSAGSELMRLTNTGRVGIGTQTPSGSRLHVFIGNDGGSGTPGVILATSNGANDIVRFQDGTTTVAVVKNDGKIFINNSSGVSLNGLTNFLSVSSTTYNLFDISRFSDNAFGPNFYLVKSRNASIGGNTIVANGDILGNIVWLGANGTGFTDAASIRAEVDGTPGASNDMPGRLIFTTTGDGSGTPTERMRINSSGNILMSATTAPSVPAGNIMMFNNTIFFDYVTGVGSPYTSNLRVDIVWNNWGSNHVAALLDVDFLAREFGNLGGVSFGRIYALSSAGATTFNNTINTTNVTTANATLAVSSPSNFMLRLLFTPTNIKDYIGCFIRIPINSAGTGAAVASITATLV